MVNRNCYSCLISCPQREICKKTFDLMVEIKEGIKQNFLQGKIQDLCANERALKIIEDTELNPPLFADFCLIEEQMKK